MSLQLNQNQNKKAMTKTKSGLFISIEGGEGSGKTTLMNALESALHRQGVAVVRTREPGGSELGEKIRSLLLKKCDTSVSERAELLLFLAARAENVVGTITPALSEGKVVLCDRFNDSTVAYQGYARGLGVDEVEKLCDFATGGLDPDLTILLNLDPAIGRQRIHDCHKPCDRIESEKLHFHRLVHEGYMRLAAVHPKRIQIIDANHSKEIVFALAWKLVQAAL